jgi:hypothetical protein
MDNIRSLSGGYAPAPTLNVQIQGMHGLLIRGNREGELCQAPLLKS